MRTTVSIDDRLLASAKKQARRLGLTLGQFIEESLRREVASRAGGNRSRPTVPVFNGAGGVRPGIDLASNRSMREALDEEQPLERLR